MQENGSADNAPAETIRQISAFMQSLSIEATRPSPSDIECLKEYLKSQSSVYLTMLPNQNIDEFIGFAKAIHSAGLNPIPHIAVRYIKSLSTLSSLLGEFHSSAGVNHTLLVGGDKNEASGSIPDVLSVIESGVLQENGITCVGIAGFPDGHPIVSDDELEMHLLTKLAALQRNEIDTHIVTQFCFEAKKIVQWITWLRDRGIDVPVRVGLAGPTSLMKWLNYARRCGVKASAAALVSQSGLVKKVFKSVAPDPLILHLAKATANRLIGEVEPHLFSFGGIGATAKWALPSMEGRIRLNENGGFDAQ